MTKKGKIKIVISLVFGIGVGIFLGTMIGHEDFAKGFDHKLKFLTDFIHFIFDTDDMDKGEFNFDVALGSGFFSFLGAIITLFNRKKFKLFKNESTRKIDFERGDKEFDGKAKGD